MDDLPTCQAYPAVPNWYTSHCATVSEPSYYIYATRNMIVVLDLSTLRFIRTFMASKDKIQAIAAHGQYCFTAGVEPKIRAWNLHDGSLLMTFKGHTAEVTVIKSIRNGKLIISGDKSGKLIVQETFKPERRIVTKVNSEVRTLAPIHHAGDDYLAVGYANGMIHIEKIAADLTTETVYQLIHPDGDGIHSLSWQPSSLDYPDIFPLLASSTRKLKSALVWNVPEEAQYTEIKLPAPSPHWTDQQRNTIWLELAWSPLHDDEIYVTSYMGMIVQYRLDGYKAVDETRFRDLHSRIAFNFTWVQGGRFAITYSIDKQIILWDVQKRDAVYRMLTHAGFLYSLDIPTWNPGQVAIGLGDSNIKIWEFMNTSGLKGQENNFYQSQLLWRGLQGQILRVLWHPSREGSLAYSTEYGRVGIYNTINNKCVQFKTYHKKGTISISWASNIQFGDQSLDNAIISCGPDGTIYAFNTQRPNAKAIDVQDHIQQINPTWCSTLNAKVKTYRCCASVDPHSRFLALGSTDGVIEVYRLDTLKIIYVASSQQSAVSVMTWRDSSLLAVGYHSGVITAHSIPQESDDAPEVPVPDTVPLQTIVMHKKNVHGLMWSRHEDKLLLASAGKDEFSFVFDVQNGSPVACFNQHRGQVLSVCWGVEDKDMLFSGGDDKFCYIWKYTDYAYTEQKKPMPTRIKEMEVVEPFESSASKRQEASSTPAPEPKKRKTTKVTDLMSVTKRSSNIIGQPQLLRHCMRLAARIYGGNVDDAVTTVRHRIPGEIDPSEYEYALFLQTNEEADDDDKVLGLFFGDKNAMRELIGIEASNLGPRPMPQSESCDGKLALEIMQSNFKAFESSPVNWIALALSPMAGKETWLNLMEAQAKQLTNQPVLAAMCFLACSKVYEAVNVYRKANMYREAIALAKLRLPPADPLIPKLFAEWADQLQVQATKEELAAMCFLQSKMTGSSLNAINLLVRRKKESYMFWAACLAVLLNDSTAEERISQYLQMLNERLAKKNTCT
ncbi:quinon protein alcohol dehydrogenase-like superfamily [Fennellomyces sp. T-0311]|nr:quinon protein alcohol dehydrogenase-like superfamily [Fennellomyces sp. T-0311]